MGNTCFDRYKRYSLFVITFKIYYLEIDPLEQILNLDLQFSHEIVTNVIIISETNYNLIFQDTYTLIYFNI